MKKMPSPQERPDLYDSFDGIERPEGWVNPVKIPDRIQKMIDEVEAERQVAQEKQTPKHKE